MTGPATRRRSLPVRRRLRALPRGEAGARVHGSSRITGAWFRDQQPRVVAPTVPESRLGAPAGPIEAAKVAGRISRPSASRACPERPSGAHGIGSCTGIPNGIPPRATAAEPGWSGPLPARRGAPATGSPPVLLRARRRDDEPRGDWASIDHRLDDELAAGRGQVLGLDPGDRRAEHPGGRTHTEQRRRARRGGAGSLGGRRSGTAIARMNRAVGGTAITRIDRGWARIRRRRHPEPPARDLHAPPAAAADPSLRSGRPRPSAASAPSPSTPAHARTERRTAPRRTAASPAIRADPPFIRVIAPPPAAPARPPPA